MKKYLFTLIIALVVLPASMLAEVTKGRIVDEKGQPIPGVMILDKSNEKWATTDADGTYSIDAAKGNTLSITCLGYIAQEIIFDGKSLNYTLAEEAIELDEAVAIGYGSVKKKDLTGSVGVLHSEVLEQQSVTQVSQSLQGTMPGLIVTRTSSMPGASATLQVRGVTTMSENSPLILVDGMAVHSIDEVNPSDIEQITVLKDGASASIYGARAAAGVILITTKNAHEGEVSINYNGEFTVVGATEWGDYLTDPVTYMKQYNEMKWNDAGNREGQEYQTYPQDYIENYMANNAKDPITYPNFDWKGNILKDYSIRHKHTVTMAYGNKVIKSRASASYENSDALFPGYNFERINARVRNNIKISKKLSGDIDFSFTHSNTVKPITTPIQAANMYPSVYLGLYPDGRCAEGKTSSNTLGTMLFGGNSTNRKDHITGRIALSWKPVEGLDITGTYTPTYYFNKVKKMSKQVPITDAYDPTRVITYVSGHKSNDLTETRTDFNTHQFNATATDEKSFNNAHNLNVMAGYEEYTYFHETLEPSSTSMNFAEFPYLDLANKTTVLATGSAYENAYRSFFGRIMYNYKGKYYVQLNARGDGSSRFASKYRWGFFPSASLGWVMSEENWLRNVRPVSYLKLRASYGALGNERIGNYPYQATIGLDSFATMFDATGLAATSQMSAAQTALAIEDITWETTYTADLGVDAAFLDNRLNLTADYYYKKTTDMLLKVEIPIMTGYSAPNQNAGDMTTTGWEVKLDWKDKVGDFTYGVGFNLSDYRSMMGYVGSFQENTDAGTIIMQGQEYNAYYGYKSSGIFQNAEAIQAAPTQLSTSVAPGDLGYIDISGPDGVPDGMINPTYDRTILGSSLPHFVYGGYVNVGWKGLNLGILFNGVGKKNSLVTTQMVRPFHGAWLAVPSEVAKSYWSVYNTEAQNQSAKYPRFSNAMADANNYEVSDYWLFDGSYFRIKNINLSYSIPGKSLEKAKIKGLKVYLSCDDPICFDNYMKGFDPEATTQSYIARTFTLGLDIKF